MAKGKHSAEAARRRADAAHEHIDRLTDDLIDAKLRARRYEQAALRVPSLVAEIERLRAQIESSTSDLLISERKIRLAERAQHEDVLARLARVVGGIYERSPDGVISIHEQTELDACLGGSWLPTGESRQSRRHRLSAGQVNAALASLPEGTVRQLGLRRAGHLFRTTSGGLIDSEGVA